jgi:mRNA interferase RelE/StbE
MYRIQFARSVFKDLKGLPKEAQNKAFEIVHNLLADDPFIGKPLTGEYKGLWKFRFGNYRIIYSIEKFRLIILILRIRHRKEVYRGEI